MNADENKKTCILDENFFRILANQISHKRNCFIWTRKKRSM